MKDQPNYYGVIPASVRYDKELSSSMKVLYSEFSSLCNRYGYCHATNGYFAKLYGVSKTTISRWISKLEQRGHIYSSVHYFPDSHEIEERRIYISNVNTPIQKCQGGIDKNVKGGIDKKRKGNNTSKNNTSINKKEVGLFENDFLPIGSQKKIETSPAPKNPELNLPYDSEKFKKAWDDWKEYKRSEFGFKFKSVKTENMTLSKLNNISKTENEAIQIIQEAIANGWKGFYPLKSNNHEKRKPDPRFDDRASKFAGASKRRGTVKFT